MTYSLSNNCTKNYYNRTFTVQVIVEDVVTWIFLKHSVVYALTCYTDHNDCKVTCLTVIMPPPPQCGGIKRRCASDVCLSVEPKSRTERPRKTKISTGGAHVTRDSDTTFKVKRSKVNLQGGGYIVAASCTAYY